MKRLGLPPYRSHLPLREGLAAEGKLFELVVDVPSRLAAALRQHELDVAFLTPIDYAREASEYAIVPGIALSSSAPGVITIYFREGLSAIKTLAIDPSSTSEIILANIILDEEFSLEPKLIPVQGTLEQMLQRADAALLYGDAAFQAAEKSRPALDLIESWNSMTDLPYVHGFWCGYQDALTPEECAALIRARDAGLPLPPDPSLSVEEAESLADPLSAFSYAMTDETREAIEEFFRFAYYRGILPDVPELQFFQVPPDEQKKG